MTIAQTPVKQEHVSNIINIYMLADTDTRAIGKQWYTLARTFCAELSHRTSQPLSTVAAILAVTSQQTEWERNKRITEDALITGKLAHILPLVNDKVATLLRGHEPLSVLGGNKIRSFFENIMGSTQTVTVDTHALHIVVGNTTSKGVSTARYPYYSRCYVEAARRIGIQPSEMQAITWECWRKVKAQGCTSCAKRFNGSNSTGYFTGSGLTCSKCYKAVNQAQNA